MSSGRLGMSRTVYEGVLYEFENVRDSCGEWEKELVPSNQKLSKEVMFSLEMRQLLRSYGSGLTYKQVLECANRYGVGPL